MIITKFAGGVKNVSLPEFISLEAALEEISEGIYKDKVDEVRYHYGENALQYDTLKKKLDLYVFACVCTYRDSNYVKEITGLFCADMDKFESKEHMMATKEQLEDDNYCLACFISPSQAGLKALFKYDHTNFSVLEAFYAVQNHIKTEHGVPIDESGKDIVRACFTSYDKELHYNPKAEVIECRKLKERPVSPIKRTGDTKELDVIASYIEKHGVNIAESYVSWTYIGMILAQNYGEAGKEAFHKISMMSTKYDYDICEKKYTSLLLTKFRKDLSIEYIYYKAGIPSQKVSKRAKPYMDVADLIIEKGIMFNVLTRKLEDGRGVRYGDKEMNTLFIDTLNKGINIAKTGFFTAAESNYIPEFNPLLDYYNELKELDSAPEIMDAFFSGITFDAHDVETIDMYKRFMFRWFLQIPATINGEIGETVMVLIGPPNVGKTRLLRDLFIEVMEDYVNEEFDTANPADMVVSMCENLVIIDDEFANKTKQDSAKLKSMTSRKHSRIRRSYGRYTEDFKRLAVFCGTSNPDDVINDNSGNRRILPIKILSRKFAAFNNLDLREFWAFIFSYWHDNRKSHELNREELDFLSALSLQHTTLNKERDLIMRFFEPVEAEGLDTDLMTATDIADYIQGRTTLKIFPTKVGQELVFLNFRTTKKKGSKMYVVVKKVGDLSYVSNYFGQ